jgi:hypothetical protein
MSRTEPPRISLTRSRVLGGGVGPFESLHIWGLVCADCVLTCHFERVMEGMQPLAFLTVMRACHDGYALRTY